MWRCHASGLTSVVFPADEEEEIEMLLEYYLIRLVMLVVESLLSCCGRF